MPIIENCSMYSAHLGRHEAMGIDAIAIQIADPGSVFPTLAHPFREIYQFQFLDAEDKDNVSERDKISDGQANAIADILKSARRHGRNIMVHCHAGICRSGAVVEVGTLIGFVAPHNNRQPNLRVKYKLMKALGFPLYS